MSTIKIQFIVDFGAKIQSHYFFVFVVDGVPQNWFLGLVLIRKPPQHLFWVQREPNILREPSQNWFLGFVLAKDDLKMGY